MPSSTFDCAAKHLCKAPTLHVPMALNGPNGPAPQHPCAVCKVGAHGSGFGCSQLLQDILPHLDLRRLPNHVPTKLEDIRYEVVCILCIEEYKKVQEDANTRMATSAAAAAATTNNGNDDMPPLAQDGNTLDDDDSDNESEDDGPSSQQRKAATSVVVARGSKQAPSETSKKKKKKKQITLDGKKPASNDGAKRATKKRKERVEFTIDEKLNILKEIDKKEMTQVQICAKYKTTKSTVTGWKRNRAQLEQAQQEQYRGKKKQMYQNDGLKRVKDGLVAFYELNENMPKALKLPITRKLFNYVCCMRGQLTHIFMSMHTCLTLFQLIPFLPESVLAVKAMDIKKRLLEQHESSPFLQEYEVNAMEAFQGSVPWAGKMARQFGWTSKALHGEAGGADVDAVQAEIDSLREKIKQYSPANVYNMDETGLFFKALPNRSYLKKKDTKNARGTKLMKAKDRVTLYVTTNADGTDKVPLSLIGKSKTPRCFKNRTLKINYYDQKKAWSDTRVFKKWWEHFRRYIRGKHSQKVLLIMDNCGPHGAELTDPDGQIEVIFLPPNVTSVYQPMDAGVIAMLKKNYRYKLLMKMFEIFEERQERRDAAKAAKMRAGTMGLNEGHAPHVRDVMDILHEVWEEVPASKIKNCWIKSTLVSFDPPAENEADEVEVVENEVEVVEEVAGNELENEDEEMMIPADTKDNDIIDLVAGFVNKKNIDTLKLSDATTANDFDDALWEMAVSLAECDKKNGEDIEAIRVEMEDSTFCQEVLAEEVKESLDLDVLCQLKEVPDEDDEVEDADDDEESL